MENTNVRLFFNDRNQEGILKQTTVLLVEDEPDVRASLESFLKRRVKTITTASNGKEGYERFLETKPDIVVSDINMPVMNGLEMAEEIRRHDEEVPIIIITAYNDQDYFMKSIEIGIDGYILKPVLLSDVLKTLTKQATLLKHRKEAEQLKKTYEDNLRLQSLTQLTKGLSHNFNNILVGIVGYVGLLKIRLSEMGFQSAEIMKYIDTIEQSSHRASELIKHLLNFSENTQCEKIAIDINEIVKNTLEVIKISVPENITVKEQLHSTPLVVNADPSKLKQAILNIYLNAKEAMPKGGELIIETSLGERNNANLKIKDSGCGMDEETKRKAFEPFFTTKGLANHLGLGLSVASSIIDHHNGLISLDSEPNKGTSITISLPMIDRIGYDR